eukprot:541104_1
MTNQTTLIGFGIGIGIFMWIWTGYFCNIYFSYRKTKYGQVTKATKIKEHTKMLIYPLICYCSTISYIDDHTKYYTKILVQKYFHTDYNIIVPNSIINVCIEYVGSPFKFYYGPFKFVVYGIDNVYKTLAQPLLPDDDENINDVMVMYDPKYNICNEYKRNDQTSQCKTSWCCGGGCCGLRMIFLCFIFAVFIGIISVAFNIIYVSTNPLQSLQILLSSMISTWFIFVVYLSIYYCWYKRRGKSEITISVNHETLRKISIQ